MRTAASSGLLVFSRGLPSRMLDFDSGECESFVEFPLSDISISKIDINGDKKESTEKRGI